MTVEHTRAVIAILVIIGFFVFVAIVLIGVVDIRQPEIAKLVGMLVGYIVALMNPIIMRYFEVPIPPKED